MKINNHDTLIEIKNSSTYGANKRLCVALVCLGLLSLSACSRNKLVNTVDDSAEYRTAKALPPLKKPSDIAAARQPNVAPTVTPSAVTDVATDREVVDTVTNEEEELAAVSELIPELTPEETQVAAVEAIAPTPSTESVVGMSLNDDGSMLNIDAEFDQAWSSLVARLKGSEVTVFSRNKNAGRIAIGCAEIGNDSVVEVKRAGGWSIFNRNKGRVSEYCALQTTDSRKQTVVTVLNRAGQVAPQQYSRLILERILNN